MCLLGPKRSQVSNNSSLYLFWLVISHIICWIIILNLYWYVNSTLLQRYWNYWSSAVADGSSEAASWTAGGMYLFLRKGFPFQFIMEIWFKSLFRSALLCHCSPWHSEISHMVWEILSPNFGLLSVLSMVWGMWPLMVMLHT